MCNPHISFSHWQVRSTTAAAGAGKGYPYLSHELALADFATLIDALRLKFTLPAAPNGIPVVAFGGSYGGKMAA